MSLSQFVQRQPNAVFSPGYRALVGVLVDARRAAAVSQRTLAERIGKSCSHVARIEQGQRRVDALELYRIARALGLHPLDVFGRIVAELEAAGPDRGERKAG